MLKNTPGQFWRVFAFNRLTGEPVTGDAANITAKLSINGGGANVMNDENPTETEDGFYLFQLTQAETNGHDLAIYPASDTPGVTVIGVPGNLATIDPSPIAAAVAVLLKTSVIRSANGLTITELSAVRGTTWALPIPITLPDGWTRIEVTARKESSDLQSESALHVAATNGGDAEDGLLIVAGVDANMNHGSIDTSGEVPLLRLDAVASTLLPIDQFCWDAKVWVGETVTQEARGTISVEKDITRTVAPA